MNRRWQKRFLLNALEGQESAEKNPQALSDTCLLLGETHLALGEMAESFEMLSRATNIRKDLYGDEENVETAYAQFILGQWYEANGQRHEAKGLYVAALEVLKKTVVPTHMYIRQVQDRIDQLPTI